MSDNGENGRGTAGPGFPRKLLSGYALFRDNTLPGERERFQTLAEAGQKPEVMMISCCDSRATPETIFGAAPGDIFVVRNVANIVPPQDQQDDDSVSAALEFAVQALGVKHVVVMGHANCGGVDAFRKHMTGETLEPLSSGNFVGRWISHLKPVADRVERSEGETPAQLQRRLEEESVRQSIDNLKTYSWLSDRFESGQIGLHGAWFDISNGDLWTLNDETGAFESAAK